MEKEKRKKVIEFLYKGSFVVAEVLTEENRSNGEGTSCFYRQTWANLLGYSTTKGIRKIPSEKTVAIKAYMKENNII